MKFIKKGIKLLLRVIKYIFLVTLFILVFTFLLSFWPSKNPNIESKFPENIVLTNLNILSMVSDTIKKNQTIVIEKGTIKEIISSDVFSNEKGYATISLDGKYIMPGLMDMHVHLFDETDLYLYLSQGITTVRNLSGYPHHLKWKKEIEDHKLIGPRILTSGPQLDGPGTAPNAYSITSSQHAAKIVEENSEIFDWLKVYDGVDYNVYKSMLEVAKRKDLKIAAHMPRKFGIDSIIVEGLTTIEHLEELYSNPFNHEPDTTKILHLKELLLKFNVAVCPTIITIKFVNDMIAGIDHMYKNDSLKYMATLIQKVSEGNISSWYGANEKTKKYYEVQLAFHLYLLKELHDSGVTIIAGTDAPAQSVLPAFSLLDELKLYKESGLSNYEVIETTTSKPAKVLGLDDKIGFIKVGYSADLLILNGSPIVDLNLLRSPAYVIRDGIIYDESQLKILMIHSKNHHRSILYNIRDFIRQIIYTI